MAYYKRRAKIALSDLMLDLHREIFIVTMDSPYYTCIAKIRRHIHEEGNYSWGMYFPIVSRNSIFDARAREAHASRK